jgi:isopenicillin-N synthase
MSQIANVPTIDIAPLFGEDEQEKARVALAIHDASRGSGFFYAANHGIDVGRLCEVVNEFHRTMTPEEKFELAINAYNPANSHVRNGYYMAVEGKKAVESFCYLNPSFTSEHPMIQAQIAGHEVNEWPQEHRHPGFREFCEQYFHEVLELSIVLLRGYALALGKPERYFDEHVKQSDTLSAVSLIRYPFLDSYPPVKRGPDGEKLSFEDHYDVSLITVLYQTAVQNLQVQTTQGWMDLPTSDENYLVNAGTFLAHLTNDYFPAPLHRVKWINAERLSLPFFVHAGATSLMQPFTPTGTPDPNGNLTIPYGEYVQKELKALIVKNGQT